MLAVLDMGGVQLDSKGELKIHKGVEVDGATEDTRGGREVPKEKAGDEK